MSGQTCTVTGCDLPIRSRSATMCEKHYYRMRRTGTTSRRPTVTGGEDISMSAPTLDLTQQQAVALWGKLKHHFINAATVIEEIIEKRAWEPMGYESFTEAWHGQMEDVTLAIEVRPHVVYQMLTEGYDYDAIAEKVKGIGRDRAESLDGQRKRGVPARDASMSTVRQHLRKKPTGPSWIHVDVGPIALKRYQKLADKHDMTVEQIAAEAIAARFEELS